MLPGSTTMVNEESGSRGNDLPASDTWSRTSSACNGCRSRKQKCGGERPVCDRCRMLGHDCEWPKAQKRGPAKGYTEALEARLIETEAVLLQILSTINVDQLSTAFSQRNQQPKPTLEESSTSSTSAIAGSKPVAVQRKAAIEYWNKFPINTPEEVSRWLADRNIGQNFATLTSDIGSKKHPDEGSDRLEMEMVRDGPHQSGTLDANTNSDDERQFQSLDDPNFNTLFTTRQFGHNVDHSDNQDHFMDLETQPPLQNAAGPAATLIPGLNPSPGSEKPGFAFSAEFKSKFLW